MPRRTASRIPGIHDRRRRRSIAALVLIGSLLPATRQAAAQTPLPCGETVAGVIGAAGEQDFYTFSGQQGDILSITVLTTAQQDAGFFASADLYDPLGSPIASFIIGNTAPLPLTGTYSLAIHDHVVLTKRGAYAVQIEWIAPLARQCQASVVGCGQTTTGSIEDLAEQDLFNFDAEQGDIVSISVLTTAGQDPGFFASSDLYGPNGVRIASFIIGDTAPLPQTGTYTLAVHHHVALNRRGAYAFRLQWIAPLARQCSRQAIACGETVNGAIDALAEQDMFIFPARQGDIVSIAVLTTGAQDPGFFASGDLYGPTGTRIASFIIGNTPPLPQTGVYTFALHDHVAFRKRGRYTLALAWIPPGACAELDSDADTLPDTWELQFGLDPGSSAGDDGSSGDPDGDGTTNAQELSNHTHPRGTYARFLAEGATGAFFDVRLAFANPGMASSNTLVRFLRSDGTVLTRFLPLAGRTRVTLDPESLAGLETAEFSTVIESDELVVVDRTMTWDGSGYGSHAETAIVAPLTTWYLAEGSTVGAFDLFYLFQNPSLTQTAQVRVRYLLPAGAPVIRNHGVPPNSRFNVWVDLIPELASTDVSAVVEVTNGVPIIVERAMYLSGGGQLFRAGHESAAVPAPSLSWFLAEGATGPFFDEFVLIANPMATAAQVRATYLLPNGSTLTKDYQVNPTSRRTIWVDIEQFPGQGAALADTAVSVTLQSLNAVPVIVERAMWWPGPTAAFWAEAHNSPGATATGSRWALAEGEVGGARATDTFILLANASATSGSVRVTLLFEDGGTAERTFVLAGRSRFNVWVAVEFPEAAARRFGTLVEGLGASPPQLVVERAMYSNAGGVVWAAGTNALGSRLP